MKTPKTIKLSNRLRTIASFVEAGSRVADIGTDHGYIPIYLLLEGSAEHAIAMDIGRGPLLRAEEHIALYGLNGQIETRLSDGLMQLQPGEADTVIIAGMGGDLMLRILSEGSHVRADVKHFILSPQSEPEAFRRGLEALGLTITAETMLCEDDKYYTVMRAEHGSMHYSDTYRYRYGDLLIRAKHPVLIDYLKKEELMLQGIKTRLLGQTTDKAGERLQEVEEALRQVRETYDAMQ